MIYIIACIILYIIRIGELIMKKNTKINRKVTVGIILLFIGMALSASTYQSADQQDNFQDKIKFVTVVQTFSSPILKEEGHYSTIYVEEANSLPMEPLNPMIPVFIKTYEFPLGTKIMDVQVTTSEIKTLEITKSSVVMSLPSFGDVVNSALTIFSGIWLFPLRRGLRRRCRLPRWRESPPPPVAGGLPAPGPRRLPLPPS